MKITIEDRLLAAYTAQKMRLRDREDEDYRARVEAKVFEKIIGLSPLLFCVIIYYN